MGDETTTTENKTGKLSPEGRSMLSAVQGYMIQQSDVAGYKMESVKVTEYEDQGKADSLKNQAKSTQEQIDALRADLAANPAPVNYSFSSQAGGGGDPRQQQLNNLLERLNNQQNELSDLPQTTYDKYTVTKKPDPRLEAAIKEFGAFSPQAKEMEETLEQEEVQKATDTAAASRGYYKALAKFMNGDYSTTDEQKAQIDSYYAPIRDVVNKTVNDLNQKYEDDDVKMQAELNKIGTAIDQTGFDTKSALEAAQVQMKKNAENLGTVLTDVLQSTEKKFKFQQDLLFDKIDKSVSQQAALLGLPPGSQSENYQKAKMKQDVFTQLQLELATQEATGKMGIAAQLAGDKKSISLAKVSLAASQGEKKERLAGKSVALTGQKFAKQEQVLGTAGQELLNIEKQKQNTLFNVGLGAQQIGLGQSALGFENQQINAAIGQVSAAAQPATGLLNTEQQRTFAENTTTQTRSPSFLDTFTGLVGAGAGSAGAIMSGIGAL